MTREEAIAILEVSRHMATSGRLYNQAIDMAIEALSAPSGDLISRADAMGAVQDHFNADGFKGYNDGQQMMDRINALPSAEQVTSKLNNPCNSLLTDGSNGSKEHKSKLDLISRQDVIEALCRSSIYAWSIEQDQTAHDWALNIIKALPSADAVHKPDYSYEADMVRRLNDIKFIAIKGDKVEEAYRSGWNGAIECIIENAPFEEKLAEREWIPCSERLPEDGQGVLVTVDANKWNIEVGSCIYSGGTFHSKLYDLDVIAWMPLPEPYKGGDDE